MKSIAVLLFLSACVAYISAEDMQFHREVFTFLDERHEHRMAKLLRDEGIEDPRDDSEKPGQKEIPDFVKPCLAPGKQCWEDAGHDACKKLECIGRFIHCAIQNHPTPLPELGAGEQFCLGLLHECIQKSPSCEGKLCCFVRIKRCFGEFKGN